MANDSTEFMTPRAVDVFCGIGGLTHGFVLGGIHVLAGVDQDESCRFAFENNNSNASFLCRDVSDFGVDELMALYPEDSIPILIGCAPCRPFSRYTRDKFDHEDYCLLESFIRLIIGSQATIVSMENVPLLRSYPIYGELTDALKANGYFVWEQDVYCPDYGIPQRRKRLVLLASRLGPIELIGPTHARDEYLTVRDAIGKLPSLASGEVSPTDPLHRCHRLTDKNLERIKATPEGGGWKDWPEELKLECHKKPGGQTFGSVYGRMEWDAPAPTMTTQCCGLGNGRFGHPEQDRAISLREAALFQTFPPEYLFFPDNDFAGMTNLERHIGNAVPVELGRIVARSISRHLENNNDGLLLTHPQS